MIMSQRTIRDFLLPLSLLTLSLRTAASDEIVVEPGTGTISAAVSRAKDGDILSLRAGEYQDSARVATELTIVGAGVGQTRWTASEYAAITVAGPNVRIVGIEFRPGEQTERGIHSEQPVRVETCRFVGYTHAISLLGAPLCDVVACEFIDCNIGIRAIGTASPTVWACVFKGGRQGMFLMDGAAYVRNSLFCNLEEGLRVLSADQPIIRNNIFCRCKATGVLVMRRGDVAILTPSIRNNVFESCGTAIRGPEDWLSSVGHCAVHDSGTPPIAVEPKGTPFNIAAHHVVTGDPELTLKEDGTVIIGNAALLHGRGIRLPHEPPGTPADIGLARDWDKPGCQPPTAVKLPEVRFDGPVFVANAVAEEYVAVKLWGCKAKQQTTRMEAGRRIDVLTVECAGRTEERKFDVTRFFGELGLQP
jgi:hypothetical protein